MARILELTDLAGAYATRLLAEAGHEVIRIENPDGDELRKLPPFLGAAPEIEGSCYHQFLNAGKKSVTFNIEETLGRELFLRLVNSADAVVIGTALSVTDTEVFQANPK